MLKVVLCYEGTLVSLARSAKMNRNHLILFITLALLVGISASCQTSPSFYQAPTATLGDMPGLTPTSNIPFKLTEWASIGTGDFRLILYLDDPSPSNAVQVLRDGLMAELANSGLLHPGYPKFTDVPVYPSQSCDVKDRYAIQLGQMPSDYFVLPLCSETEQDVSMTVYILRSGSLPILDHQTSRLYIGIGGPHNYISGQKTELLFQALTNLGLAAYPGSDSP
jgi:hypothetical protein